MRRSLDVTPSQPSPHAPEPSPRTPGRRRLIAAGSTLAASLALPRLARAQSTYPDKPVKVIIPFPPGGGADAASRLMAEGLSKALGQPFVIEARPGGNSTIAGQAVARAPADGYTLLMTGGSLMSVLPLVQPKLPLDPLVDLVPIGMVSRFPYIIAAATDFGANTLGEVLAKARARPDSVAYASNGNGTMVHLAMEWLTHAAGVEMIHVQYKGFAPAVIDVVGGRTPVIMADWPPIQAAVQSGRIKPLAVTSATRAPNLPDVPTLAELGFKGVNLDSWFGLFAPAGTPAPIVTRLSETLNRWGRSEEARAGFLRLGHEAAPTTPADVRARIAEERKVFAEIVTRANIRIE